MSKLYPMRLGEHDFFEIPSRFEIYEAICDNCGFRIVFCPLLGLYVDVLHSDQRCKIVKNKYKNNLQLRDFEPVLILYYYPITECNSSNKKVISLRLGFRNIDGKEYADYTALFDNNELEIDFDEDKKESLCKLANLLYLSKTEMTCYNAMLNSEFNDVLKTDCNDVRKLKSMSSQAIDKLREIKITESVFYK